MSVGRGRGRNVHEYFVGQWSPARGHNLHTYVLYYLFSTYLSIWGYTFMYFLQTLSHQHNVHHFVFSSSRNTLCKNANLVSVVIKAIGI